MALTPGGTRITLDGITTKLFQSVQNADTSARTLINNLSDNPSPQETLALQAELQRLQIQIEIMAGLTQIIGQSIKGTVSKFS